MLVELDPPGLHPERLDYVCCDLCAQSFLDDVWQGQEPRTFYHDYGPWSCNVCDRCLEEYLREP